MKVSIVGAGPAGAMAAIRLAQAGASVSLFDPSHPREKSCGGGLTGRALGLVADVIDIAALPAVVVTDAVVESPATVRGGGAADSTDDVRVALVDRGISPCSSLVVLSRAVLDQALANAAVRAGATLIAEQAIAVSRRGRAMIVRTPRREHTADFLIGADGANSLVRKTMARPFLRSEVSIAAGFYVHGVRASAIAVRCMAEQPGYLWSFPRPDHLAVGICAPATARASSSTLRAQSAAWIQARDGARDATLIPYAWPIPSVGFSQPEEVRASGPGWMLLGDAAGLVDPLTREGIYYALQSGQWAADAIMGGPAEAETAYAERLSDEIYPELRRAARLSGLFFSPAFSALFVTALRQSAPVREVFADLVAGTQPYNGLRRRLMGTREWILAGRAALLMVQSQPLFARVHTGM